MRKIALIEDDADLFTLVKYNLEKEGFAVVGSPTGRGVIDLFRREKPDLILLNMTFRTRMDWRFARAFARTRNWRTFQ